MASSSRSELVRMAALPAAPPVDGGPTQTLAIRPAAVRATRCAVRVDDLPPS